MYFVFEGMDGTGKSTVSTMAVAYLTQRHKNTIHARNPGATALGRKLREIIKYDRTVTIDPLTERLLFLCDNSCYVNTLLKPALASGDYVVADRSNFISDLAYGEASGVDLQLVQRMHALVDAPMIDVMWILNCPWDITKVRMQGRDEAKCKIEERGDRFFNRIANCYKELSTPDSALHVHALKYCKKIITVDASKSKDDVWDIIRRDIDSII